MIYDDKRVELFEILYDKLKNYYFPERTDKNISEDSFRLFSFFEAYFSNYIEGESRKGLSFHSLRLCAFATYTSKYIRMCCRINS